MFEKIDFGENIEEILKRLSKNATYAISVRRQIKDMQAEEEVVRPITKKMTEQPVQTVSSSAKTQSKEEPEDMQIYIEEYRKLSADDIGAFISLLPSRKDYQYENIILRLQAESIREIKEMIEIQLEDPESSYEDIKEFIEQERRKIEILKELLVEEKCEEEETTEENKIVLIPSKNGKIRLLDDIEGIDQDHYAEFYELIRSIITGRFKGLKSFTIGSSAALGRVSEVRGPIARVLFQRLDENTYAVYSAFIKKTSNDRGYRGLLVNRVADFKEVEEEAKESIRNPEFMELNQQFVQELWNKLGYGEDPKTYRKDLVE